MKKKEFYWYKIGVKLVVEEPGLYKFTKKDEKELVKRLQNEINRFFLEK